MSALQLIVTAAGYAAIVNAENTGTGPVLVSQIGITDQVFTADANTAALPGELKRLATFGGAAVSDDTIHVTIRDDSADSYTLRGFGLYSAANVLLAVYSHAGETPDFIMQKAAAAMLLLQTDVRFTGISATSITFGNADFLNPPATETVPGVVQFATDAIIATGSDNTRAVHAKGLKALLDSRFGAGAPSAFVKGLLSLATAAALRLALELKGAALKDEGDGNGLDADLLDGQHGAYYRNYNNLTNVPGSFPPSAHSHTWAQLSDPPTTATRWPTYAEVTNKPASFPPSAHTHAIADIVNLATELAGRALSNHSHVPLDAGGRLNGVAATVTDWNNATENGWYMGTGAANAPDPGNWWIGEAVQHNPSWITQTVWQFANNFRAIYRRQRVNNTWSAWERCRWHESEQDARYLQKAGDEMAGGLSLGSAVVATPGDMSRHLLLHASAGYGFSVTTSTLNYNVNAAGVHAFRCNGVAVASISVANGLSVAAPVYSKGNSAALYFDDRTTGTGWAWYCQGNLARLFNGTGDIVTVTNTGALSTTGGYDFGSSRKLKEIDGAMPYGLEEVRRISTLIGRYRPEYNADGRTRLFFDAEQFLDVMPEAVDAEGVEFNGERVPAIKLDQVMPPAYRAIGQLADIVEQLQREIAELKASR